MTLAGIQTDHNTPQIMIAPLRTSQAQGMGKG
jgi:hypothetical protein